MDNQLTLFVIFMMRLLIDGQLFIVTQRLVMLGGLKKQAVEYFSSKSNYKNGHSDALDSKQLQKFYLMLIMRQLDTGELIARVKDIHSHRNIQWRPFLNCVWSISMMFKKESEYFNKLAGFVRDLSSPNSQLQVNANLILDVLPDHLLDSAGIIQKKSSDKKTKRAYMKFYYDQKKHNLFHENNEGYARLALLLATMDGRFETGMSWERIQCLLGNYDLDPDRVLDMIIQSSTQSPNIQIFYSHVVRFKTDSIATIVGNRISQNCKLENSQKIVYAGIVHSFITTTPQEIYHQLGYMAQPAILTLAALLVKNQVVSLQAIFAFLSPEDSYLEKLQAEKLQNGRFQVEKAFKIILDSSINDNAQKINENYKFMGQLLHSSKLAFIAQLVRVNDWGSFKLLWQYYRHKVDLLIYQPLMHALFDALEWIIDPLYQKISLAKYFKRGFKQIKTLPFHVKAQTEQLVQLTKLIPQHMEQLDQLMELISEYIGFNSSLYIKMCRLMKKIVRTPDFFDIPVQNIELMRERVKTYVKKYLVVGLSYQQKNPCTSNELYQLLECFDYKFRYSCYFHMYKYKMADNPYLTYLFEKVKTEQVIIVNNLSSENKKIFVKKLAKITHNQGLQTFYWIFRRLMIGDYEAVVPEIVEAMKSCTQLSLEHSAFIVMHSMISQKEPAIRFKIGQASPWYKNLVSFISFFYRKYIKTDIQCVFDYIIMKTSQPICDLEQNQELPGAPLLLIKTMLAKMFGSFIAQDNHKSKYDIICAGQHLQTECLIGPEDEVKFSNKKCKAMFTTFFWDKTISMYNGHSLAFRLLVLLVEKKLEFLHKTFLTNMKIIGDVLDSFRDVTIQLIRFLDYQSSDYVQYARLLPPNSLDLMLNHCKLPLAETFEIYRPSVQPISQMSDDSFEIFCGCVQETIGQYFSSDNKYIGLNRASDKLKAYLGEGYHKFWQIVPKNFFTTFWMLTLDSISFPSKLYHQKIEEVKKKIEQKMPSRSKDERDREKMKNVFLKLQAEQETQEKKFNETMSKSRKSRFQIDYLKNHSGQLEKSQIQEFAEVFVEICLLPRILIDVSEALYCFKFTIEMIKANFFSSNKILKLLTHIIEYVMNYLPYTTEREAAKCLSVYLSEMFEIFVNWSEINKLKSDLNKYLGISENYVKDKHARLKEYLLKIYQRAGEPIMSVTHEPYLIKNCLYLLDKIESIPAYKEQAEQLEQHLNHLKSKFDSTDMQTILQRQISKLNSKKNTLPQKPEEEVRRKPHQQNAQVAPKPQVLISQLHSEESKKAGTLYEPNNNIPQQSQLEQKLNSQSQNNVAMPSHSNAAMVEEKNETKAKPQTKNNQKASPVIHSVELNVAQPQAPKIQTNRSLPPIKTVGELRLELELSNEKKQSPMVYQRNENSITEVRKESLSKEGNADAELKDINEKRVKEPQVWNSRTQELSQFAKNNRQRRGTSAQLQRRPANSDQAERDHQSRFRNSKKERQEHYQEDLRLKDYNKDKERRSDEETRKTKMENSELPIKTVWQVKQINLNKKLQELPVKSLPAKREDPKQVEAEWRNKNYKQERYSRERFSQEGHSRSLKKEYDRTAKDKYKSKRADDYQDDRRKDDKRRERDYRDRRQDDKTKDHYRK